MLCLSSYISFVDREGNSPIILVESPKEHLARLEPTNAPHLITLVTSVYENHRIGRREPNDPYILISRC